MRSSLAPKWKDLTDEFWKDGGPATLRAAGMGGVGKFLGPLVPRDRATVKFSFGWEYIEN